jgi:hypothetical protein
VTLTLTSWYRATNKIWSLAPGLQFVTAERGRLGTLGGTEVVPLYRPANDNNKHGDNRK